MILFSCSLNFLYEYSLYHTLWMEPLPTYLGSVVKIKITSMTIYARSCRNKHKYFVCLHFFNKIIKSIFKIDTTFSKKYSVSNIKSKI